MENYTGYWWCNIPDKFRQAFISSNKDTYKSRIFDLFDESHHQEKVILYIDDPDMQYVGLYEFGTNMRRLHILNFEEELPFLNLKNLKERTGFKDIDLADNSLKRPVKELSRSQAEKILTVLKSNKLDILGDSIILKDDMILGGVKELIDDDGTPLVDADGVGFTVETDPQEINDDPIYTDIELIKYNSYSIKDSKLPPAFQVEQIADVFAEHIEGFKKDNGQMLCVTGKWGRGKTYFINKLCDKLNINYEKETSDDKSKFHFVKFHAWKYQDTPAIWAYLYKILINSYADEFNNFNKWKFWQIRKSRHWQIFKLSISSKGHWSTWVKSAVLIGFAFLWYFIFSINDKVDAFKSISLWFGGTTALLFFVFKVLSFRANTRKPLKKLFQSFSKIPSFNQLLGFQAEIQTELIHLLKAWINKPEEKRLLLFIDDLDRCSEDRMIQIVDALRVMLEDSEITSRMIVLIAVDEEKLKKAIRHKYKDLYEEGNGELDKLENEYMDKLFISGIKLAPLSKDNRVEFFETILKDENHPVFDEDSGSTDSSDREGSFNGGGISSQASEESRGDSAQTDTTTPSVEESIELSEHEIEFFKIELENKEGLNPRQIRILYYRYRLARNLWVRLHPSEQFPSEAIVTNLFLDKPEISEAQGKDVLEMVNAY